MLCHAVTDYCISSLTICERVVYRTSQAYLRIFSSVQSQGFFLLSAGVFRPSSHLAVLTLSCSLTFETIYELKSTISLYHILYQAYFYDAYYCQFITLYISPYSCIRIYCCIGLVKRASICIYTPLLQLNTHMWLKQSRLKVVTQI